MASESVDRRAACAMRIVTVSLLLAGLGCASLSARSGRPNFTGTWALNLARSRLAIPAPDSTIFVIRHEEPTVRMFRTHARAERLDTVTITLRTDSSEVLWEHRGAKVTSRTWWDGSELVFWSGFARDTVRASQVVRYSLSADRKTFTAVESVDAGAASHVNRWVLDSRR